MKMKKLISLLASVSLIVGMTGFSTSAETASAFTTSAVSSASTATVKVKSLKLSASKGTLTVGKTYTIKHKILPTNATNKRLSYSSSNSKVAAVSSKGVIKAVSEGTATITVKTTDKSNISAKILVTVKEPIKYYTFRSDSYLEQHFEKHGNEFEYSTAHEYLDGANKVINSPDALHKTEKEDGDDIYFLESTGEFVVVSTDGYIRTYFKPDDGIDYYERQ